MMWNHTYYKGIPLPLPSYPPKKAMLYYPPSFSLLLFAPLPFLSRRQYSVPKPHLQMPDLASAIGMCTNPIPPLPLCFFPSFPLSLPILPLPLFLPVPSPFLLIFCSTSSRP